MPTYQYRCDQCEWEYNEVRSIHESQKVTHCPSEQCTKPLRRIYTVPPIAFKGDGFYSRDQKLQVTFDGQEL